MLKKGISWAPLRPGYSLYSFGRMLCRVALPGAEITLRSPKNWPLQAKSISAAIPGATTVAASVLYLTV